MRLNFASLLWIMLSGWPCLATPHDIGPANAPAQVNVTPARLDMVYDGAIILTLVDRGQAGFTWTQHESEQAGAVTQIIALQATGPDALDLQGDIVAGPEAFACEADRRPDGLAIVRHAVGPSVSRLNRAVYDRGRDWLVAIDRNPAVQITSLATPAAGTRFTIRASGRDIVLRFRPHFFQRHRKLAYFKPWEYRVWPESVAGWCSWFAYFTAIDEGKVRAMTDLISTRLARFGYSIIQIDDGYQQDSGTPETWLKANAKFPSGLADLAAYIRGRGLVPGIWTNVAFNPAAYADQHRDWFVRDASGQPVTGRWINRVIDGANPAALDALVRPVYRGLHGMGWGYVKLDALRHLRYEGYNSHAEYFTARGVDRVQAYRQLVAAVRAELGQDTFLLGCWGIRPELVGLIDGCRLGDDGFSYAGLAQFNSFNNVVWRNDPDHIELSPQEAYRSTMVTSLTGSLLMVTDKPETYAGERIEAARRAAPVLVTRPGQLYDVDPSRSAELERVDLELSGAGPRPFDAGYVPACSLYALEINRPWASWLMLGRTGNEIERIPFGELGLEPGRAHLVFEFWSRRLLGSFSDFFIPGAIDPHFNCQLFCIRPLLDRPQLVATSRHISCGALEIEDLVWESQARLRGRSRLVGGDPYDIYLHEPTSYRFLRMEAAGAKILSTVADAGLRMVRLRSDREATVDWSVHYEQLHGETP
jgi:alpha-galactosidase